MFIEYTRHIYSSALLISRYCVQAYRFMFIEYAGLMYVYIYIYTNCLLIYIPACSSAAIVFSKPELEEPQMSHPAFPCLDSC